MGIRDEPDAQVTVCVHGTRTLNHRRVFTLSCHGHNLLLGTGLFAPGSIAPSSILPLWLIGAEIRWRIAQVMSGAGPNAGRVMGFAGGAATGAAAQVVGSESGASWDRAARRALQISALPMPGTVVPMRSTRLPTVWNPVITPALANPSATHPNMAMIPVIPVSRGPHIAHAGRAARSRRESAVAPRRYRWRLRPQQWWARRPRRQPEPGPTAMPYENLSFNTPS